MYIYYFNNLVVIIRREISFDSSQNTTGPESHKNRDIHRAKKFLHISVPKTTYSSVTTSVQKSQKVKLSKNRRFGRNLVHSSFTRVWQILNYSLKCQKKSIIWTDLA